MFMQNILKAKLKKIEKQITKIMPSEINKEWLYNTFNIESLQDNLIENLCRFVSKICKPGIELLNRGGKRWRPLLMLLCCEISGGLEENILEFTPIVEIVHNGTLIIDDIEDNSEQRRGMPSIHKIYGTDLSINTGNFMYFLPTHIIFSSNLTDKKKNLVYKYFLDNMRRLHIGQGLDILWHNDHSYIPGEEEYFFMCRSKTGCLSRMASEIGAEIGGRSDQHTRILGKISENLGVAFQILDDVKNLTKGNPGKSRGDDIVEGKKSLPVILLHKNNPNLYEKLTVLLDSASEKGYEKGSKEINDAIEILSVSGSISNAQKYAELLLDQVNNDIDKNFSNSGSKELLKELINSFL